MPRNKNNRYIFLFGKKSLFEKYIINFHKKMLTGNAKITLTKYALFFNDYLLVKYNFY